MGGQTKRRGSATNRPGARIRLAREALGLSRIGLAYKAGVDLRTVARIEDGEVKNPRRSTVTVLEQALEQEAARA